ncbi:MAG TPA: hypothetical protein VFB66_09040, partial [Tepidisphaeraceae bacterium]|nr:hypothetical protein [Tepidisphaeraceae bacterium]
MRTPLRCAVFICLVLVIGPATADEKDPSVSPMRSAIERYRDDRGALSRTNNLQLSPARHERLKGFYDESLKSLERADFDALDTPGRVDYLLLRNELRYELKRLNHRKRELDEASSLLPFAQPIVELEQARRRVEDVDPTKSAEALTAISRQVAEVRKSLEE